MKKEQILKKAIEKAVKNGYKGNLITELESGRCVTHCSNDELILSRDFAKAFWHCSVCNKAPEQFVKMGSGFCSSHMNQPWWSWNLQQLALAKDRLAYLSKFLKGGKNENK